jgi:putative ABC transport system ATP-binding protein
MEVVIRTEKLARTFRVGEIEVPALKGVDLKIRRGELLSIMGASGSGKSTLMNLLGCLDTPTGGAYYLDGERVSDLTKNERAAVRNRKIGFIFQGFNLLARSNAIENVELPLFYSRDTNGTDIRAAAVAALERVGLQDRLHHTPSQLSGGQQQRVAIARALVNNPSIVLADEPTGNLDSRTSVEIVSLLQKLNREGVTVVIVTHERDIALYTQRIVRLRDGHVTSDEDVPEQRDATRDLSQMPVVEE